MAWLVVHGILTDFHSSVWKFWTLLVRFLDKLADFINFEADDADSDVIDECDLTAETVSDDEFIDDETQIDENIADYYYAFTNVSGRVEDAMQDFFLELDSSKSHEVNNYCNDNYDPDSEQTDEVRDSAKQVEEFVCILLCPRCLEN